MNPLYNGIRYNSEIRYNVNQICTKISGTCIFSLTVLCYVWENIRFGYLLESPHLSDSNKYTKTYDLYKKRTVQKYPLFMLYTGPYQVYNSKFDFTAKSLVTNTVVIKRVLCVSLSLSLLVYNYHSLGLYREGAGLAMVKISASPALMEVS